MAEPLRRDLVARRNTPFSKEWTFRDDDGVIVDFTAATVAMQVRLRGAQPGDALISLVEVTDPQTEGLIASDLSVQAWIDEATLSQLPRGAAGASMVFKYDLKVQAAGRVEEIWMQGDFTVKPGITDRLTILTNETGDSLTSETGSYLIGA